MANTLVERVRAAAALAGIPVQAAAAGSMWGLFFTRTPVTDYATARQADTATYARVFHTLLEAGVYLAPSQYEAAFVSTTHDEATLTATLAALHSAFALAAP
jgi:glutamate-1-semialdehyde 2,1-aminomutase